jgi:hypothetical protein
VSACVCVYGAALMRVRNEFSKADKLFKTIIDKIKNPFGTFFVFKTYRVFS